MTRSFMEYLYNSDDISHELKEHITATNFDDADIKSCEEYPICDEPDDQD